MAYIEKINKSSVKASKKIHFNFGADWNETEMAMLKKKKKENVSKPSNFMTIALPLLVKYSVGAGA